MINLHYFANPARFERLAQAITPWLAGLCALAFAVGLYLALLASPPDYQQGETVRIMYVHVPAAWLASMIYVAMGVAALTGFVWRHPVADVFCRAAAPVGASLTAICLITGSLWGKPMWGAWWVWDARLTSVLILFLLYLGYILLVQSFAERTRGDRAGAMLLLVGIVNIPVIRFSVERWNTLHQPASVFRAGGSALDPSMLYPLLVMALAYALLSAIVILLRMRIELATRRIGAARVMQQVEG